MMIMVFVNLRIRNIWDSSEYIVSRTGTTSGSNEGNNILRYPNIFMKTVQLYDFMHHHTIDHNFRGAPE